MWHKLVRNAAAEPAAVASYATVAANLTYGLFFRDARRTRVFDSISECRQFFASTMRGRIVQVSVAGVTHQQPLPSSSAASVKPQQLVISSSFYGDTHAATSATQLNSLHFATEAYMDLQHAVRFTVVHEDPVHFMDMFLLIPRDIVYAITQRHNGVNKKRI